MRTFDTRTKVPASNKERRTEVLHQTDNFKIRIIELPPGGNIPPCDMADFVVFHVLSGSVNITANGRTESVNDGQITVSEPAIVSMASESGARILGIQIQNPKRSD